MADNLYSPNSAAVGGRGWSRAYTRLANDGRLRQHHLNQLAGRLWCKLIYCAPGRAILMRGMVDHLDAVVLAAVQAEYEEAQNVTDGVVEHWTDEGPLLKTALFRTSDGGAIRVGLALALDMRAIHVANAAHPLIHQYRPTCLAMCGVCAGRRGAVALGDVVIGDPVFTYDAGAIVANPGDEVQFRADPDAYRLNAEWRAFALALPPLATSWFRQRKPPTAEEQAYWLLETLAKGGDPTADSERHVLCPQWRETITLCRKNRWIATSGLRLLKAGEKTLAERRILYPDPTLPTQVRAHVGGIATGSNVMRDPTLFDRLSTSLRSVLAVDMEASAVGAIAAAAGLDRFIVMKGVMDHGDGVKDDLYKRFAARASAEYLFAFLRSHVVPERTKVSSRPSRSLIERTLATPFTAPSPRLRVVDGTDAISALKISLQKRTAVLFGPSGCGKSTIVRALAHELCEEGIPAIVVWAGAFNNDARTWVSQALPADTSIDDLLANVESGPFVLIVDALNECRSGVEQRLAAQLRELMVRHRRLQIVATAQSSYWADILFETKLEVRLPDAEERIAILLAQNPVADSSQLAEARFLATPLDLTRASRVWPRLAENQRTAYGLRAAFARSMFANDSTGYCLSVLRQFAEHLFETMSSAIPSPEFIRWPEDRRTTERQQEALSSLRTSRVLVEVDGYTGFTHETMRDYFMCESLLAKKDGHELTELLTKPRFAVLALLVLEAQSDAVRAAEFIRAHAVVQQAIAAILDGDHGRVAQEAAHALLPQVISSLDDNLTWDIEGDTVTVQQPRERRTEDGLLAALGQYALRDRSTFAALMAALGRIDSLIRSQAAPTASTLGQSVGVAKAKLYSSAFWIVMHTRVSTLLTSVTARINPLTTHTEFFEWVASSPLTISSMMYLSHALRRIEAHPAVPALLLRLLNAGWPVGWSQLRIAILEAIQSHARKSPAEMRTTLLHRLRELETDNILVNTSLLEALEALGEALESPMSKDGIQADILGLLATPLSEDARRMAYGLAAQQFEFLEAISQPAVDAIDSLDEIQRARLYAMACLGSEDFAFNVDYCLTHLPTCDRVALKEDRELLHEAAGRWAAVPSEDARIVDPATRAGMFLYANTYLARCGHWKPMPISDAASSWMRAWLSLASLTAASATGDQQRGAAAWAELGGPLLLDSWPVLSWALQASTTLTFSKRVDLAAAWPRETRACVHSLLRRRSEWRGTGALSWPAMRDVATERLISVLGDVGDGVSRAVLLEMVDDTHHGATVVAAIKSIDSRGG